MKNKFWIEHDRRQQLKQQIRDENPCITESEIDEIINNPVSEYDGEDEPFIDTEGMGVS